MSLEWVNIFNTYCYFVFPFLLEVLSKELLPKNTIFSKLVTWTSESRWCMKVKGEIPLPASLSQGLLLPPFRPLVGLCNVLCLGSDLTFLYCISGLNVSLG